MSLHNTAVFGARQPALALLLVALIAALLSACASAPRATDWQLQAKSAMDRAVAASLEGNTRIENAELARARAAVASTGRPELAARLELLHCASHTASLSFAPCAGYQRYSADAAPADQAYARYLAGQLQASDAALLPPPQRAAIASNQAAVTAIEDPLSRLVAAAVAFQTGSASPATIQVAVDTASSQGWRRPLLAWLGVQLSLAERNGLADEVARLSRRIELAQGAPTAPKAAP